MGASPQNESTLRPLIDISFSRISSWSNKFVNLGGRVVILNSSHVFYRDFTNKYLEPFFLLAKEFPLGVPKASVKLLCFSWMDVCRPNSVGGVGLGGEGL